MFHLPGCWRGIRCLWVSLWTLPLEMDPQGGDGNCCLQFAWWEHTFGLIVIQGFGPAAIGILAGLTETRGVGAPSQSCAAQACLPRPQVHSFPGTL